MEPARSGGGRLVGWIVVGFWVALALYGLVSWLRSGGRLP